MEWKLPAKKANPHRLAAVATNHREWGVFLLMGLIGCWFIGLELRNLREQRRGEAAEAQELARWQRTLEQKNRRLRRLQSDKGREIEARNRGGLRRGEQPLPVPPETNEPRNATGDRP